MTKKENYLCFTQNTKEHTTRAGTTIKIFLACCREFFIITFLRSSSRNTLERAYGMFSRIRRPVDQACRSAAHSNGSSVGDVKVTLTLGGIIF